MAEQQSSSDAAAPPLPVPPSDTAFGSGRNAAPLSETPTAAENMRVVALLISGQRIIKTAAGGDPLYIGSASPWQPNKAAIEARYQWLSRMMGGPDQLVKLALNIMSL